LEQVKDRNTQYLFAALQTELPASRQIVLIHMANAANVEGECWISHATLAQRSGCSVKHVQRVIVKLRKTGWIEVLTPARQHRPARYRLDLEITPSMDCVSTLEPPYT